VVVTRLKTRDKQGGGRIPHLADDWRSTGPDLPGDLNDDGIIDVRDLNILADYWLNQCQP
jgi:hypothetical protein